MAVLVSDSFNRTNVTNTLGSTDSYNGGSSKTWASSAATAYGVISNQAYKSAGGATLNRVAYVDPAVSNYKVKGTFATVGAFYLVFRVVDDNSHLYVLSNGATDYKFGKKIAAGAFTVLGTISVVPTNGDVIEATVNGSSITVTINGANATSATDAYNQTATKAGFVLNDNTSRLDNFQVEDLSSGTTHNGAASLIGVSTLTASATVILADITGEATIQGVGIVTATADVVSPAMAGSASMTGVGTVTATASVILAGSATLTGVSTLTAFAAGLSVPASASLVGVGYITATAIEGQPIISSITLYAREETTVNLSASEELTVNLYALTINSVILDGGP